MSLSLVQGYESPEEEPQDYFSDSDEEYAGDGFKDKVGPVVKSSKLQQEKPPPRTSDLPTAFEMFTEVIIYPWTRPTVIPSLCIFVVICFKRYRFVDKCIAVLSDKHRKRV